MDEKKIKDKIDGLRKDEAAGPDRITPKQLKMMGDGILKPLYKKKNNKRDAGKGRPVSLKSIPVQSLGIASKRQNDRTLDCQQLDTKSTQHGFMPGRSCATNITSFLESVMEAKDSRKSVDMIYLDFSKAFDKVPHKRLLPKLRAKGTSEEISRRIEH